MVVDEEPVEQLRYMSIVGFVYVLERGTEDIRGHKGLSCNESTSSSPIHTNPILDGIVLEGVWVLGELRDKLKGECRYLESILNEETY